jgi:hypothetical protein
MQNMHRSPHRQQHSHLHVASPHRAAAALPYSDPALRNVGEGRFGRNLFAASSQSIDLLGIVLVGKTCQY